MPNRPLETVRAEDFVEYFLFPAPQSPDNNSIDQDLDDVAAKINEIATKYCGGYIWHKDGFRVMPRHGNVNLLIENDALDNAGKTTPGDIAHFTFVCVCV